MPSTSARATTATTLRNDHRRDGETSVQRRHPGSSGAVGTATVENTPGDEVADPEENSTDDADNTATDVRPGDHDQLAQDLAQMLDVGVRPLRVIALSPSNRRNMFPDTSAVDMGRPSDVEGSVTCRVSYRGQSGASFHSCSCC